MAGYKIKDIETLTGIKAHTLRIWEKRYDLLCPNRTLTKIRTYTDQDLVKLLNISILYNHGWKISKIAKFSDQELRKEVDNIYSGECNCTTNTTLLIQSTIELEYDFFNQVLSNTIKKDGLEQAYRSCLDAFLIKIVDLWKVGRITPVQKHFVFNLIRQKLIAITDQLPEVNKKHFDAVLFTPEGETNEITLLFYNYILQKNNYRTLYLGANLPFTDLKATLHETHPKCLVISLMENKGEELFHQYLECLNNEIGLPIYVGGTTVDLYGLPKSGKFLPIKELL